MQGETGPEEALGSDVAPRHGGLGHGQVHGWRFAHNNYSGPSGKTYKLSPFPALMTNTSQVLIFAGLLLALLSLTVNEAEAKEPVWNYDTGVAVRSIAISAEGKYIAAGGYDSRVYLFERNSSTLLWSNTTGNYYDTVVAISADGKYITAGNGDRSEGKEEGEVYLFEKDKSNPLWNYVIGDVVRSVAISADGKYIIAGSLNNRIYLFEKESNTPLWSYDTGGSVLTVAISGDGEYIVAGNGNNRVYFFHRLSSMPLWNYLATDRVYSVSISSDGKYIAAGTGGNWNKDNNLYLFNRNSGTPLWNYKMGGDIRSVSISADGEYIAAGSHNDRIYLFQKDNSTPLWNYKTKDDIWSVAISANGEYITAGSKDKNVYLFHQDNSTPLWNYTTGSIPFVAISGDGSYLAAGSMDDEVYYFFQPIAVIDAITPTQVEKETSVMFQGHGNGFAGDIITYSWNSSIDEDLGTSPTFSVSSLSFGYHNISFRVRANDGYWSIKDSGQLWVYTIPRATIEEALTVEPGDTVEFNGSGTDEDGYIVFYEWDFDGDGVYDWSSSENGTTTHIYDYEGEYTAAFRVTDSDGFTGSDTRIITVTKKESGGGDGNGSGSGSILGDATILGLHLLYWLAIVAGVAIVGGGGIYWWRQRDAFPPSMSAYSTPSPPPPTRSAPMFAPTPEQATIECPGCNGHMTVPKLGRLQTVKCNSCGLEGEIEI